MFVTYFSLHIFLLTPTMRRFCNEIVIEHTPITTILKEHTHICSNLFTIKVDNLYMYRLKKPQICSAA